MDKNRLQKITNTLNLLIYAGTWHLSDNDPDRDANRKIMAGINVMCVVIISLNIGIGIPVFFLVGKTSILVGIILETVLLASAFLANYFGKYKIARLSIYLIMSATTFYFGSIFGKSIEIQLMIVYLVGVSLFMFSGWIHRSLCICLNMIILFLLEKNLEIQFIQPIAIPSEIAGFMRWLAYFATIVLVVSTFSLYAHLNRSLLSKLGEHAGNIQNNLENEEKKNNIKTTFFRNSVHEVNGSFYSILVIIQILNKIDKQEALRNWNKLIGHLGTACQNLKMLINNILEYSKIDAKIHNHISVEPIDLRLLFSDLVETTKYPATDKGIKINFAVADDIPDFIAGDRVKIIQIASNLVNNAIKFGRTESNIFIQLEKDSDPDYWKLSVEDESEGIQKDKMDRIFDPFYIEKKGNGSSEGMGLGLHITKELVQFLKGKITVASKIGVGSRFTISLPLYLPAEEEIGEYHLAL